MNLAEALMEGAQTAVIGLSTVFAVLIILMIVIYIMTLVFYKKPKTAAAPEPAAEERTEEIAEEITDDAELIAVLTAAVAASLNTSTYNLQIKSYRRVDNKKSAWNKAGIRETIDNRF